MNDGTLGQEAMQLLETLAQIKRLMQEQAIELRRLREVTEVLTRLETFSYPNGPVLEGYVDVALANGNGITWSFDVTWDRECWTIEAVLNRQSSSGQEAVRELPVERLTDFREFLAALTRITSEMLSIDLKTLMSDSGAS